MMPAESPQISVVMAVYNGAVFLERSLQGISNQTFQDFEFIVVDDGSTDETLSILQRFEKSDPRIRLLSGSRQGQTRALIRGVAEARGEYIARQDADDVSLPERLSVQIGLMKERNNISLIGSWYRLKEGSKNLGLKWFLNDEAALRSLLISQNPFCHSSVLFPKELYDKAGGYDADLETGQDLDLWLKLGRLGKLAIVNQTLVEKQVSRVNRKKTWCQIRDGLKVRLRYQDLWKDERSVLKIRKTWIRQILISLIPFSLVFKWRQMARRIFTYRSEWFVATYLFKPRFTWAAVQKMIATMTARLKPDTRDRPVSVTATHDHETFCQSLSPELWQETKEAMSDLRRFEDAVKEDNGLPRLGGGGNYFLLYFLVRYLKPEVAVETGVGLGYSSYAILSALERNQKGSLWSSDLPYLSYLNAEKYVGYLVPSNLRYRWKLDMSGDRKALAAILSEIDKIDFFHYDSDKSYQGREFALHQITPKLSEKGVMMMDDIQNNSQFMDYSGKGNICPHIFEFKGKWTGLLNFTDTKPLIERGKYEGYTAI
ncbi:MAG: glycosyltransferase [Candidatus Omnitrophica bacterium]|nr:glycosyltransferase [Candidatus Omnitrophota bacterium]